MIDLGVHKNSPVGFCSLHTTGICSHIDRNKRLPASTLKGHPTDVSIMYSLDATKTTVIMTRNFTCRQRVDQAQLEGPGGTVQGTSTCSRKFGLISPVCSSFKLFCRTFHGQVLGVLVRTVLRTNVGASKNERWC